MAGMLQILTYMLAFYLVFKGIEIFQIALMSNRADRTAGIVVGILAIIACTVAAFAFVSWQDMQAQSMSSAGSGVR